MSQWEAAEHQLARMVKGVVVTDLTKQYADIDVETDNFSYSVKCQNNVLKYNSILFETLLIDTYNNSSMDGSFLKCEADRYAIKFDNTWLLLDTQALKEMLLHKDAKYPVKTTQGWLEDKNKAEGRTYNRAKMLSLTPKQLINSPAFITGTNYKGIK